ncbi:hypothetical protein DVH24_008187 [Malus domestica]|uniref:Uncharacterized protein n=1 Tax=Malus domestica TaxID=3750 RepID=A0A498JLF5_MALDO|nr:hypothetical protein DVH24_008187 [Malus domestica]
MYCRLFTLKPLRLVNDCFWLSLGSLELLLPTLITNETRLLTILCIMLSHPHVIVHGSMNH